MRRWELSLRSLHLRCSWELISEQKVVRTQRRSHGHWGEAAESASASRWLLSARGPGVKPQHTGPSGSRRGIVQDMSFSLVTSRKPKTESSLSERAADFQSS